MEPSHSDWTIDDRPESDWIFIQRHGLDVAQLPRFNGQRELAQHIIELLTASEQPVSPSLQDLVNLWRMRKREGLLREDAELEITRCADELDALRARLSRESEQPVSPSAEREADVSREGCETSAELSRRAFKAGWYAHQAQQTDSGDSKDVDDAWRNFNDDGTGMSEDEKQWLG